MLRKCSFLESMVVLTALASAARADVGVQLVGQWGGAVKAVAVEGERAYVGVGPRLIVLNVAQPSAPMLLGQSAMLPDVVQGVAVSGGYAYVTVSSGLRVIDVSTPAAPARVGACDTGGAAIVLSGDYAYVMGGSGLQVIDISNPAAPVRVGVCSTGGATVAVSGGYAYVAGGEGTLQIIDLSNPAAPVRVAAYDAGAYASHVAVSGTHAYLTYANHLDVIDISNPAAPVRVGGCDVSGDSAQRLAVSGSYVYVTFYVQGWWGPGSGCLEAIDISSPTAPVPVGRYYYDETDEPALPIALAVSGGHAYVAWEDGGFGHAGGLDVFDVSDPTTPARVAGYDTSGRPADVAVSGGYAYVTYCYGNWGGGLQVLDISKPTAPFRVAGYAAGGYWLPCGGAFSGEYAYLVGNSVLPWGACPVLEAIDVSNAAAPVRVGRYDPSGLWLTPEFARDVAISGDYAYLVGSLSWGWGSGVFEAINISNPAAPVRVGNCDMSGSPRAVAISGGYAYVAGAGLQVIDISNPTVPVRVAACDTAATAYHVAISGGYAYVTGDGGLEVIDISNPAAPVRVGGPAPGGGAVAVSGGYAYVAYETAELRVIDISNPAAPVRVGGYHMVASAVAVSGGYVYVGDYTGSLVILALDHDQDGVVDPQDSCPNSDLSTTVILQTCDTGVENKVLADGCTMADMIAASAAQARNHGALVSGVATLTNEWKKAGLITSAQKDAIQSCAASASIP